MRKPVAVILSVSLIFLAFVTRLLAVSNGTIGGTTPPGDAVQTGGRAWSTITPTPVADGELQAIHLDGYGNQYVYHVKENTYTYSTTIAPGLTATDFILLVGSASKKLQVKSVCVTGTSTVIHNEKLQLVLRSTVSGGPTPTLATPVPNSSTNPGAAGRVFTFAATPGPPTPGTSIGPVATWNQPMVSTTPTYGTGTVCFDFGQGDRQAPVVNGAAQCLALTGDGTVAAAASFDVTIVWSETN